MKWSLKIAQVAGIGIFVHWTFLILLGWIVFIFVSTGKDLATIAEGVGLILALFGCVVLHELGHALTGRRFGVKTLDITLLPIGGVARLERMPEEPWHEFWIAIAGPAVNVVIAAALLAVISVMGRVEQISEYQRVGGHFLAQLMVFNVILVVFNLLPAFPMDGGRILRSLLAVWLPRVQATHIAASVGQVMAILFGLVGLMSGNLILLFIALFVYLGAQAELRAAEMRSIFQNVQVQEAMTTDVQTLAPGDSVQHAVEVLLAGHQQDFPILDDGRVVAMLRRSDLVGALSSSSEATTVAEVAGEECPVLGPRDPLHEAVEQMHKHHAGSLPVVQDGRLIGLLTSENVGEWAMIQAALRDRVDRKPPPAASPAEHKTGARSSAGL